VDRLQRHLTWLAAQSHGAGSRTCDAIRAMLLGLDARAVFEGRASLVEESRRAEDAAKESRS
jgi:hypothetical protein